MPLKPYGAAGEDPDTPTTTAPPSSSPPPPSSVSSGSPSAATSSAVTSEATDTSETTASGLGGDPEFWYDTSTKTYYVVYYAPGDFDPPIPILWSVPDNETLKAFGGGDIPDIDKKLSTAEMDSTGAVFFGTTNDLPDSELDPWNGFKERIDRASEVQPWLADEEVYALVAAAYIEGRPLETWELKTTDWWQSRNDQQRAWAELSMGDPKTAEQHAMSDRIKVAAMFDSIGAAGNDQELIDWMANQYTVGNWSQEKLAQQIEAVTSGWGDLDPELEAWMTEGDVSAVESLDRTEDVRNLFTRWLGPAYPPTDEQVAEWATKLRNDPSAEEALTDSLRASRMALYPEYADENLTYDDIATPWRGVMSQMWGETPDETDAVFQDIVRMNNLTEAQQYLRKVGLSEGNQKVTQDAMSAMHSATGGSLRKAI